MNKRRLTALLIAAVLLIQVAFGSMMVFADDEPYVPSPDARLVFDGLEFKKAPDGSVQALLDVRLRNLRAISVGFGLQFDSRYFSLSDYQTNAVLTADEIESQDPDSVAPFWAFSAKNPDGTPVFSFDSIQEFGFVSNYYPAQGDQFACVQMMIAPYMEELTGYIDDQGQILAEDRELTLGTISFRVDDPAALQAASADTISGLFSLFTQQDNNGKVFADISLMYQEYDFADPDQLKTCPDDYVEFNIRVENDPLEAEVSNNRSRVSYDRLYQTGTIDDLFAYLNKRMNVLTLGDASGTYQPAQIVWDKDKAQVLDENDNPVAWGTPVTDRWVIHVVQDYTYGDGQTLPVTATIEIAAVNIVDYDAVGMRGVIYEGTEPRPDLLPVTGKPVFDQTVLSKPIAEAGFDWAFGDALMAGPDANGVYTVSGMPNTGQLRAEMPWVSRIKEDLELKLYPSDTTRYSPAPTGNAQLSDDGTLTITATMSDGSPVPDGTTFDVRLPDGTVLSGLVPQIDPVFGVATIQIPRDDIPDAALEGLRSILDGTLYLSATLPDEQEGDKTILHLPSDYVPVKTVSENYYMGGNSSDKQSYVFDYTGKRASLFVIEAGHMPSNTVTLAVGDYVETTFDGLTGVEPGRLNTVTVNAWTRLNGPTSDTVIYRGTLAGAYYADFGNVENYNGKTITLVLQVSNSDTDYAVDPIDDVVFDTLQAGYPAADMQIKQVTVSNVGSTDIPGLSAVISGTDPEAFVMLQGPMSNLPRGGSTVIELTTKPGLESGTYHATVSLMVNGRENPLETFNLTFTVTDDAVYKITVETVLKKDDGTYETTDLGVVALPNGSNFTSGTAVSLTAQPKRAGQEPMSTFLGWELVSGPTGFNLSNLYSSTTSFTMPSGDIKIRAIFEETLIAKLSLSALKAYSGTSQMSAANALEAFPLYVNVGTAADPIYAARDFDPARSDYYVLVPNNYEVGQLEFSLRDLSIAQPQLTRKSDVNAPESVAFTLNGNLFTTQEFGLPDIMPDTNVVDMVITGYDEDNKPVTLTYHIHFHRQVENHDYLKFSYGNTPFGRIMSGIVVDDPTMSEEDRKIETARLQGAAKADFLDTFTYEGIYYSPKAWIRTSGNVDADEYALVIYQGETYRDPLLRATDSLGGPIAANQIVRTITVDVLDPAGNTELLPWFRSVTSTQRTFSNQSEYDCAIDLFQGDKIRPGIYTMQYSFPDYDGTTLTASRTIVVLSPLGDLDVSSVRDDEDVQKLERRMTNNLPDGRLTGYGISGTIYKYRVCDVNRDEAVNGNDATLLDWTKNLDEFYPSVRQETTNGGD